MTPVTPQAPTPHAPQIDLSLRVLLTDSAAGLIQPQVAAWYADETYTSDDPTLNPVEFAKRSAAIVVLPANTLASAALGLSGNPAQTVPLTSERSALCFPT